MVVLPWLYVHAVNNRKAWNDKEINENHYIYLNMNHNREQAVVAVKRSIADDPDCRQTCNAAGTTGQEEQLMKSNGTWPLEAPTLECNSRRDLFTTGII